MNKEIIKEFLKPDWRKILLIIIFSLGLITLFPENPWLYISWEGTDCKGIIVTGGCTIYKGLPFPYETTTSTIMFGNSHKYSHLIFLIDQIIWILALVLFSYLGSYLIIFTWNKFRTKK